VRASARAAAIARLTLTKKAYDVEVLDLRGLTTMADFFVVCSADSENQIRAIADAVEEGMEDGGELAWHREAGSPNWVLLDYVDVVLHVFHKEARSFYSLEKLWGDAAITAVKDGISDEDLEGVLERKAAEGEPQPVGPEAGVQGVTAAKGKKGPDKKGSGRKAPGRKAPGRKGPGKKESGSGSGKKRPGKKAPGKGSPKPRVKPGAAPAAKRAPRTP
jgi:ribosome-associated protein